VAEPPYTVKALDESTWAASPRWWRTTTASSEGQRGWVNYLAVSPHARRGGIGRALMNEVELRLGEARCPNMNLQVRETNHPALGFYRALGYTTDDVISLGRRLEHDDAHPDA
jgi:ribosomal protein S18 acetylase RimI-like enzyme